MKYDTIKTIIPEKCAKKYLEDSIHLQKGVFVFDNPWDMECCKKGYSLINSRLDLTPNGDPEWVYSLSRLEYLNKLLIAYMYYGKEEYLSFWKEYVYRWYRKNNCKKNALKIYDETIPKRILRRINRYINTVRINGTKYEKHATYRSLDTAIRNCSVLAGIIFTPGLRCTERKMDDLLKRVGNDAEFTVCSLRKFDETSNWGIIICANFISTALMLKYLGKDAISHDIDTISNRLYNMLSKQIYPDGGHCEASSMYHTQILICLLRMLRWTQIVGIVIDKRITSIAERMLNYAIALSDCFGNQIMYGDSDLTNISTVVHIGAIILNKTIPEKFSHAERDWLLLFEFGYLQENSLNEVQYTTNELSKEIVHFDDGIYKYKWAGNELIMYNTTGTSGHKHADNGSFVYYNSNNPYIIDSGRYTYCFADKRKYYKGHECHNVVTIDEGVNYRFRDPWHFCEYPIVKENRNILTDAGITIFQMGYYFESNKATINRFFICYDDGNLIILDNIKCSGLHVCKQFFSLDPFVQYSSFNGYGEIDKEGTRIYIYSSAGTMSVYNGTISFCYNEETAAQKLSVTQQFEDSGLIVTVISSNTNSEILKIDTGYRIVNDKSILEASVCNNIINLQINGKAYL